MDLTVTLTVKDFPEGFDHFARELAAKVASYLKADLEELAVAQEKVIDALAHVEALAAAREVRAPYDMPPVPMEDEQFSYMPLLPSAPPDAPSRAEEQLLFPGPVPESGDATDMARRQAMQSQMTMQERPPSERYPVTKTVEVVTERYPSVDVPPVHVPDYTMTPQDVEDKLHKEAQEDKLDGAY